MTTDEAIEIVARRIASTAVLIEGDDWGCYPEIGEYHWRRIQDMLDVLCPDVPGEAFAEAYDHLERLAEGAES